MWEENFGTQAEGVRLIWGPLNTGFTVERSCFSSILVRAFVIAAV